MSYFIVIHWNSSSGEIEFVHQILMAIHPLVLIGFFSPDKKNDNLMVVQEEKFEDH